MSRVTLSQRFKPNPGDVWDEQSRAFLEDPNVGTIGVDDFLGLGTYKGDGAQLGNNVNGLGKLNPLLLAPGNEHIDTFLSRLISGGDKDPVMMKMAAALGLATPTGLNGEVGQYGSGYNFDPTQIRSLLQTRREMKEGKAFGFVGPDGTISFRRKGDSNFFDALPEGTQRIDSKGDFDPFQKMFEGPPPTGGVTPVSTQGMNYQQMMEAANGYNDWVRSSNPYGTQNQVQGEVPFLIVVNGPNGPQIVQTVARNGQVDRSGQYFQTLTQLPTMDRHPLLGPANPALGSFDPTGMGFAGTAVVDPYTGQTITDAELYRRYGVSTGGQQPFTTVGANGQIMGPPTGFDASPAIGGLSVNGRLTGGILPPAPTDPRVGVQGAGGQNPQQASNQNPYQAAGISTPQIGEVTASSSLGGSMGGGLQKATPSNQGGPSYGLDKMAAIRQRVQAARAGGKGGFGSMNRGATADSSFRRAF